MKKGLLLLVIAISLLLSSCNLLSVRNISNDFKWRNKKFKRPFEIALSYHPEVITKIQKTKDPLFLKFEDTVGSDSNYRIRELLIKKFEKRNIVCKDSGAVRLYIDRVRFEEYSEGISVTDNSGEFMGMDYKDYFIFEMEGRIMKDTIERNVNVRYQHTIEPRESYLISGMMVYDGIGASTERMIENAVNIFTYRAFEQLNKLY